MELEVQGSGLRILGLLGLFSQVEPWTQMSHSLNSLKGGYIRDYVGVYYRGY